MPNETIYLNTKEHDFVKSFPGENFSQRIRNLVQGQMDQRGLEVKE